ncbi:survival of motor neuron-related-splicing factor 30 [Rhizophagus irregularis DAOM 181602=DAOM 197198]|nr:survival of motor neuron-related-splicing factor 30 [Rhizophagus irregularis DAOM 181602=DAOM 197198]
MNAEELAQYQYQLDQVNLALKSEPENSELLKLKTDLTELINLTNTIIDQEVTLSPSKRSASSISPRTNSTPTTPTSFSIPTFTKPLQVGDSCLARWSGDGQFYQAQITAIGEKNKKKGLNDKKDKDKKKKSGEGQKKINEQNLKQKSWLAFASGSAMAPGRKTTKTKRLVQPPINKKSIFATPENPEGKVGVVGSGKPMTQFQQRDQCENIMKYIEVGWYYYYRARDNWEYGNIIFLPSLEDQITSQKIIR